MKTTIRIRGVKASFGYAKEITTDRYPYRYYAESHEKLDEWIERQEKAHSDFILGDTESCWYEREVEVEREFYVRKIEAEWERHGYYFLVSTPEKGYEGYYTLVDERRREFTVKVFSDKPETKLTNMQKVEGVSRMLRASGMIEKVNLFFEI